MTRALALAVLLLLVGCATVGAEEPPRLTETEALTIRVLALERALIEQRHRAEVAEARAQFAEAAQALDRAVEAAATRVKVKLADGWRPDLDAKVWKKAGP